MTTLNIKVGSPRHTKILAALRARFDMSRRKMDTLHTKWQAAEEKALAYIPERDVDVTRRLDRELGKPQYTTLSIPYSYAMLMTAHTYWTSVFLARSPIMQYTARHGETRLNVQAVEALMDYQTVVGKHLVPYYIWLYDKGKYGIGILGHEWVEEEVQISELVEQETMFMNLIPTGKTKRVKQTRRIPGYQGNRIFNVRPYDWFPDTRVPLNRFHEGEFVSWREDRGWNDLLKLEAAGEVMNLSVLEQKRREGGIVPQYGTSQQEYPTQATGNVLEASVKDVNFQKFMAFVVELVPERWGLGSSRYPEKWLFRCTTDFDILLQARPFGALHDQFPFDVMELEPEGYALINRSMMEILEPLQNTMDWLFNTHMYNVRKALNDQFIIDPSKVQMSDVYNPLPGGLWRLRPSAYGTDVNTVAAQLRVTDVTQTHVQDMREVALMMQRVMGINENVMGMLNPGGRKTATEVRTSSTFGVNRLKTQAEYDSALGFASLSQKMLSNTQQYYSLDRQFKIAGDLMQTGLERYMQITAEDIQGFYDFVPVDGTLPVDRFAQANLWRQLLADARAMPEFLQGYDLPKLFAWVAQLAGLKNLNAFKLDVQPDNVLQDQAQRGNVIPVTGGNLNGGGTPEVTGGAPGGSANSPRGVPSPDQIAGVGPTG